VAGLIEHLITVKFTVYLVVNAGYEIPHPNWKWRGTADESRADQSIDLADTTPKVLRNEFIRVRQMYRDKSDGIKYVSAHNALAIYRGHSHMPVMNQSSLDFIDDPIGNCQAMVQHAIGICPLTTVARRDCSSGR
jgi:hypothetical protein